MVEFWQFMCEHGMMDLNNRLLDTKVSIWKVTQSRICVHISWSLHEHLWKLYLLDEVFFLGGYNKIIVLIGVVFWVFMPFFQWNITSYCGL